ATTVAAAAVVVAAVAFGVALLAGRGEQQGRSLTPETAQAGQCVDVATQGGRVDITEADCSQAHDAEIVHTAVFGDAIGLPTQLDDARAVCTSLMDAADVARLHDHDGALAWGLLIDDPSNIDPTDRLVCYVRAADGRLRDKLLG
ncbi:MAG: hypothetical protein JWN84_1564, partial [Nocardioides sp.]|nr:hypothetical protein [Nocardioides sp.]